VSYGDIRPGDVIPTREKKQRGAQVKSKVSDKKGNERKYQRKRQAASTATEENNRYWPFNHASGREENEILESSASVPIAHHLTCTPTACPAKPPHRSQFELLHKPTY
jgi:hypothetical protein